MGSPCFAMLVPAFLWVPLTSSESEFRKLFLDERPGDVSSFLILPVLMESGAAKFSVVGLMAADWAVLRTKSWASVPMPGVVEAASLADCWAACGEALASTSATVGRGLLAIGNDHFAEAESDSCGSVASGRAGLSAKEATSATPTVSGVVTDADAGVITPLIGRVKLPRGDGVDEELVIGAAVVGESDGEESCWPRICAWVAAPGICSWRPSGLAVNSMSVAPLVSRSWMSAGVVPSVVGANVPGVFFDVVTKLDLALPVVMRGAVGSIVPGTCAVVGRSGLRKMRVGCVAVGECSPLADGEVVVSPMMAPEFSSALGSIGAVVGAGGGGGRLPHIASTAASCSAVGEPGAGLAETGSQGSVGLACERTSANEASEGVEEGISPGVSVGEERPRDAAASGNAGVNVGDIGQDPSVGSGCPHRP